ncbi:MAG: DUF4982 domain-containing protein [Acidobacteriia bacterium]|nr:DUF4982 domain-containing protein [Terriglobia bacterium]
MKRAAGFLLVIILPAAFSVTAWALAADSTTPRLSIPFDQGWKFHLGDAPGAAEPTFDDHNWRVLDLPHDWSIELPFDAKLASGTGFLPGGIGWYRKAFRLPPSAVPRRVGILFDGVYANSEVWINGHYLGKRPYGYVSFQYDLTPYLSSGSKQDVLAVRVDHSRYADSRWYTGSGIYRHVWMTATGAVHVAPRGTFITAPEISRQSAVVAIKTRVSNDGIQAREVVLRSTIKDSAGKTVAATETARTIKAGEEFCFEQGARFANPMLWSPETPHLYYLVSGLKVDRTVVDEYETPFGVRTIFFDPSRGFLLNGVKTVIKGVCLHHDAGSLGAAVPDRVLERRLQLLKELGCNAIRTSHNPPAPELLDMCDRMGFLVMDEAFDEWARPKKKWIEGWNAGTPGFQGYAEYFNEWAVKDIQSMVDRDKNHPCVILWSIGNEIDYDKDPYFDPQSKGYTPDKPSAADLPAIAAKLIEAVKAIDPSRPTTAALANIMVSNRLGLPDLLDVVGYNYLEKFYSQDHTRYPARKMVGSENSHAYSAWKVVEDLGFVSGQFLWTGFDYLGEARQWPARSSGSGVLDECGFKKPAFYFRQSLWAEKPMVYIAVRTPAAGPADARTTRSEVVGGWNWPVKDGDPVAVVAYTNCEQVELLLNGKSQGEKSLSSAQDHVLSWEVLYAAGTLKAIGKNRGAAVCSWELRAAGKTERIKMNPDASTIIADGRDVSHVEVVLVDGAGNPVFSADDAISFKIAGKGRIIGVDSGDIRSHESFKAPSRKAYQGRCLVIIQSTAEPGTIQLKATAPGLAEDRITISATAPKRR